MKHLLLKLSPARPFTESRRSKARALLPTEAGTGTFKLLWPWEKCSNPNGFCARVTMFNTFVVPISLAHVVVEKMFPQFFLCNACSRLHCVVQAMVTARYVNTDNAERTC